VGPAKGRGLLSSHARTPPPHCHGPSQADDPPYNMYNTSALLRTSNFHHFTADGVIRQSAAFPNHVDVCDRALCSNELVSDTTEVASTR
jgi:hypothetical protein